MVDFKTIIHNFFIVKLRSCFREIITKITKSLINIQNIYYTYIINPRI